MKKLFMTILTIFSLIGMTPLVTAQETSLWEQTKLSAANAADWSAEKLRQGWEATKSGAAKAGEWAEEKNKNDWKTSEKSTDSNEKWVRVKTDKGWKIVKNG